MSMVAGWVYEQNIVRFLEHLSRAVGYTYDTVDGDCARNGVFGPTRRAEVRRDGHRE